MANKRNGQITVSAEWARHLRPILRRSFWKGERQAGKRQVERERAEAVPPAAAESTRRSDDDRDA